VFRTPIGFHDAYVAAPSMKAALEAWGAESNLFAQGIAEVVSDPRLMKAPLERPGEVIRVARGSADEHLKATGRRLSGTKKEGGSRSQFGTRKAKPSRGAVDAAEELLATTEKAIALNCGRWRASRSCWIGKGARRRDGKRLNSLRRGRRWTKPGGALIERCGSGKARYGPEGARRLASSPYYRAVRVGFYQPVSRCVNGSSSC